MNLKDLKNIAEKNYIDVSSKWFLEKIKDRYRWPITYFGGQPTVEVILEDGSKTNNLFLADGYVNSDLVIDAYDKGYTVLLSRIQKMHPDILNLGLQTDKYCNQEVNMNVYFGKGTSSVSFPSHTHEYAVLVKSIEGESEWVIGGETKLLKDQEAIYFDAYVPHAVTKIIRPKLTITCNLVT
jgi:hypothetical protein